MPNLLKCSRGHEWELSPDTLTTEGTVCPTCGATVVTSQNANVEETRIYQTPNDAMEATIDAPADSESPLTSTSVVSSSLHIPGFEILNELGRGGMGVVYRARQVGLNRTVAVKMILAGTHAGAELIARFRAEAESIAKLQHANIVQVYEIGEHEGRPYFALEYVDGGSLSQRLAGVPLPVRDAAQIAEQLARAVEYAHEHGVIHRDLKPANVLLAVGRAFQPDTDRGSHSKSSQRSGVRLESLTYVPKITDFGLAKQIATDTGQTQSGAIMGTPSYMAPEQAAGMSKDIGPAADIYSLGAILYEMLVGRPPFRAATLLQTLEQVRSQEPVAPSRLQPGLHRDLETICLKCLQKDAAKRYESAAALADDLARFLGGEPIDARPVSTTERAWRWAKRKPALASLTAAVLVLGLTAIVLPSILAFNLNVARKQSDFNAGESKKNEDRAKANATRANDNATRANDNAKRADDNAKRADDRTADAKRNAQAALEAQARAEAEEKIARRRFYAAQMNLAQEARERGQMARVLELLETQRPRIDEEDLRSFEWYQLWDVCFRGQVNQRELVGLPLGSFDGIASLDISPDGQTLAAGLLDGDIHFWTLPELTHVGATSGRSKGMSIGTMQFSPDGRTLAARGPVHTADLWDVNTRRVVKSLPGPAVVTGVAFTPDGKQLVVGYNATSNNVQIVDVATGKVQSSAPGATGHIETLAVSPDGRWLAAGQHTGVVQLWSLDGSTATPRSALMPVTWIGARLAFSPDSQRLVTVTDTARLWDVSTGRELASLPRETGRILRAVFSPDGQTVCFTTQPRQVHLWNLDTNQVTVFPTRGAVHGAVFARDGRTLFTGGEDRVLRQWRLDADTNPRALPITGASCVAFSPTEPVLAIGGKDGRVTFVDALTGGEIGQISAHQGVVKAIAFSADGSRVATGGADSQTKVWNVKTREAGPSFFGGDRRTVNSLSFSPDGLSVAASFQGYGPTRIWDLSGNQHMGIGNIDTYWVPSVAFAPAGRTLAVGEQYGSVRLWNLTTRRLQVELEGFTNLSESTLTVALSRDGRRLASGSTSGAIKLWDVASQARLATFTSHATEVHSVAFFPDGQTLASAAHDGTIRLWDMTTLQERATLRVGGDAVVSLAVAHDGSMLAAVSGDGIARVWRVSRDPAALARRDELDRDDPASPVALVIQANKLIAQRPAEAETVLLRAEERLTKLTAKSPVRDEHLQLLSTCRNNRVQALKNLAQALEKLNRPAEALAEWQRMLELVATLPITPSLQELLDWYRCDTAPLLWKLGRTEEALAEADSVVEMFSAKSTKPDDVNRHTPQLAKLATLYSRMGQTAKADDLFARLLIIDSKDSGFWNNLAWQLVADSDPAMHDPPRAVGFAQKAVALAPQSAAGWNTLGVAQYRADKLHEAVSSIDSSMAYNTKQPLDWLVMAMALHKLGDPALARLWYDRAERVISKQAQMDDELKRFHAEAQSVLGLGPSASDNSLDSNAAAQQWLEAAQKLVQAGERRKAIVRFDAAIELRPDDPTALLDRATAYRQLKSLNDALADYSRLLVLTPDNVTVRIERIKLYELFGQPSHALADLEVLIASKADDPAIRPLKARALTRRAEAAMNAKQWDKANAEWTAVIELTPDNGLAWFQRGMARFSLQQYEPSAADFDKAAELGERGPAAMRLNRGIARRGAGDQQLRRGELAQAEASFNKAVTLYDTQIAQAPEDPWLHWERSVSLQHRAQLFVALDRKQDAEADYDRARAARIKWLDYGRKDDGLRNIYCDFIVQHLPPSVAVRWTEVARHGVTVWPADAATWTSLGIVEFHISQWSAANAALDKSLELRPEGDGPTWFFSAMTRWKLDDKEQANQRYDRGVKWLEQHAPDTEKFAAQHRIRKQASTLLGR